MIASTLGMLATPALAPALALVPLQDEAPRPASPAAIEAPALRVWTPPSPARYELPQGGVLLALPSHELPLVDGLFAFHVGTIHEPAERVGLAEILADALREGGSNTYPGPELDAWLDQHAASIDVSVSEDRLSIAYHCLAEDTDAVLERAMSLVTDPAYPEAVVELARVRARTAIARRRDDTRALADATLDRVVYGWDSPWGRQATEESVSAVTAGDLAEFHRAQLGPDRLVAGVTGDARGEHVAARITELWGEAAAVGAPPEVPPARFSTPPSTRIYLLDRPGVSQTELRIASIGTTRKDPDYAALYLWSNVVGIGGMTNRMMQRVRTELGLAYGVGGVYRPGWDHPGYFYGFCGTANATAGTALEEMAEVIVAGGSSPIPPGEIETVRKRTQAADVFRVDTDQKVLGRAVDLVFHDYPADYYEKLATRIGELNSFDLAQAVRSRYAPQRQLFVAVGPADEIEPGLERIAAVFRIPTEPGRPVSTPEGRALASELLTALGGAEGWAALDSLAFTTEFRLTRGTGELLVETEQWRDLTSLRMRVEQLQSGRRFITVLDGAGGWSYDGVSLRALTEAERSGHTLLERRSLYRVLRQLARGRGLGVSAEGRRLVVTDDLGPLLWIDLDEDGTPLVSGNEGTDAREIHYVEWGERDGLRYPARFEMPKRQVVVEITHFEPNVELDPELFRSKKRVK